MNFSSEVLKKIDCPPFNYIDVAVFHVILLKDFVCLFESLDFNYESIKKKD